MTLASSVSSIFSGRSVYSTDEQDLSIMRVGGVHILKLTDILIHSYWWDGKFKYLSTLLRCLT